MSSRFAAGDQTSELSMDRVRYPMRLPRFVLLILLLTPLVACTIAPQRYSTPQAQTFTLQKGDLEADGLAFLTPSTVTGQEEDKQALALIFASTVAQQHPTVRLVPLSATISAINQAGLTDVYKGMYREYRDTGVFDPEALRQIGQATRARFLGQLKMAAFGQRNSGRFGIFGLDIVKTQTATIRLYFQIWDTHTGAIAWEGAEELAAAYDTLAEKTVSFKSVVEEATRELIALLP